MTGRLILVAGPSGAGKDTLIRLAQERLREDKRFVFVRRVITRPQEAGGEDHVPARPEDFARLAASGDFALSWEAHGLRYGVPRAIEAELAEGRLLIVNVSRAVIPEAMRRYPHSEVVIVTAPMEMLAARLAARGREPQGEHRGRLARPDFTPDATLLPHYISNDRKPEDGAEALIAILRNLVAEPSSSPAAAPPRATSSPSEVEKTA